VWDDNYKKPDFSTNLWRTEITEALYTIQLNELEKILELMESGQIQKAYDQLYQIVYPQTWNVNET
jgi:hypothetical protein